MDSSTQITEPLATPAPSPSDLAPTSTVLPKKKFPLQLLVGAVFFLLLIIGGGVAFYLSTQKQDIRQQASTGLTDYRATNPDGTCPSGYVKVALGGIFVCMPKGTVSTPSPTVIVPGKCIPNGATTTTGAKCCSGSAAVTINKGLVCIPSVSCLPNGTLANDTVPCCSHYAKGNPATCGTAQISGSTCLSNGKKATTGEMCCSGDVLFNGTDTVCAQKAAVTCLANDHVTSSAAMCCSNTAVLNGTHAICSEAQANCWATGVVTTSAANCCSGFVIKSGDQLVCAP